MKGSIYERKTIKKDGTPQSRWYTVVDLPRLKRGKRQQKWFGGYSSRDEAEFKRIEVLRQLEGGALNDPDRMLFDDWVKHEWLPNRAMHIKPSTLGVLRASHLALSLAKNRQSTSLLAISSGSFQALQRSP